MIATQKKVIVAPLNWGLGHASRCVPIINALISNNFTPIIASDGISLQFLQQEFPNLETLELPAYQITYSKNLKLKLVFQFPKIWNTFKSEKKVIKEYIDNNSDVVGIISDNRFGVYSKLVPSVYITHQLKVFSGITTFISTFIHQKIIKKFDECWIPDTLNAEFSGELSSIENNINKKFIGVLSRFKKENLEQTIDVLAILSGPEPNRTFLEQKLIAEFKNDKRNVVFVLGKVANNQQQWKENNITFYNYLLSKELQKLINLSIIVICRSGYSSIMDLAVLQKKVFFIPTKHQPEQEYLAKYLSEKKLALYSDIKSLTKEKLQEIQNCKGLSVKETQLKSSLFSLFQGE